MEATRIQKDKKVRNTCLFFLLAVLLLMSCGCTGKRKVTYIPLEERAQKEHHSVQGEDIVVTLREYFKRWQGTRYRHGGLSKKGVDCSGFTLLTYQELFGLALPRTVREQVKKGKKVPRASLKPGDLVFFKTGSFQRHVGIYVENEQFIHASRSKGVTISELNNRYWQKNYWRANRL